MIEDVVRWRVGDGHNIRFWHDRWAGEATLEHEQSPEVVNELSSCMVSEFILGDWTWDTVKLGEVVSS